MAAPLPAPGSRDSGYDKQGGELRQCGNSGISRSSATSSINGIYLLFSTSSLKVSNPSHRAYGFQLRCLSE
ncbi:hypothetical protein [uncultured Rikenella sp.]|uniref:hypothetical protein n=1 Tax=uncultured Rikenella sp. TaxID=368003 RepID=UPI00272B9B53|nr:hypothetical protein [uncultured Rikenella sp.]